MNKGLLLSAIIFIAIIVSIAMTMINFSKEQAQQEQRERLTDARQDLLKAEADLLEARIQAYNR